MAIITYGMNTSGKIYELDSGVQHYAWGCRSRDGKTPYIADLLGEPAGKTPWAELWIGAHPSLCSKIIADGATEPLSAFIAADQQGCLGKETLKAGYQELPFLLKVPSCERALSIQSHPDKATAEKLHEKDPRHYPDANQRLPQSRRHRGGSGHAGLRPAMAAGLQGSPVDHPEGHLRNVAESSDVIGPQYVDRSSKRTGGTKGTHGTGRAGAQLDQAVPLRPRRPLRLPPQHHQPEARRLPVHPAE